DNVEMPAGFNPSGDDLSVRNCDIASAPWGSALSVMEALGVNMTFENNIFRATADHPNTRGLIYLFFDASATRTTGTLRFKNNVVDLGPYQSTSSGVSIGVYILVQSTSGAVWRQLEIADNTIFTTVGSLTANRG